jgi:hypothetical protein
MMCGGDALERQGRAVVAQQIGVQCLQQRQRLDARNETVRPMRRPQRNGILRANGRKPWKHEGANAKRLTSIEGHQPTANHRRYPCCKPPRAARTLGQKRSCIEFTPGAMKWAFWT